MKAERRHWNNDGNRRGRPTVETDRCADAFDNFMRNYVCASAPRKNIVNVYLSAKISSRRLRIGKK